jgi:hypothetical protein
VKRASVVSARVLTSFRDAVWRRLARQASVMDTEMGTGQLLAIMHPLVVETDSGMWHGACRRAGGLRRSSEDVSGDGFVAGGVGALEGLF